MNRVGLIVSLAALVSLAFGLGCGRLDARRDFEFGLQYYTEQKYDDALLAFARAAEEQPGAAILHNLALTHLAALRDSTRADGAPTAAQIADAHAAVATARGIADPSAALLARLGYIDGSVYVIANDPTAARLAFEGALEADADFAPALAALLRLSPDADSITARLVLATTTFNRVEPIREMTD